MAFDAKVGKHGLEEVRIPSGLHDCVDSFMGGLKLRILEGAARKASLRTTDAKSSTVNVDDIVQFARAVFVEAASEFERVLRQHETLNASRLPPELRSSRSA